MRILDSFPGRALGVPPRCSLFRSAANNRHTQKYCCIIFVLMCFLGNQIHGSSFVSDYAVNIDDAYSNTAEIIGDVLHHIEELGFVDIREGLVITSIPPKFNVYCGQFPGFENRWSATLKYLRDYGVHHNDFSGSYFVCLYDGWRELSMYSPPEHRLYTPWESLTLEMKERFKGFGTINEPRFQHDIRNPDVFPELPLKVLCFNRYIDDRNALLLPDSQFLNSNGFDSYRNNVRANDTVEWRKKAASAIWRGREHTWGWHNTSAHPRDAAVIFSNSLLSFQQQQQQQQLQQIGTLLSHSTSLQSEVLWFNASYQPTSIKEQLKYRFILDIDGQVNAWSGLFWKLLSTSLVIKKRSVWEQWYYKLLIPNYHYVVIDTYDQVQNLLSYCANNEYLCQQVAAQATALIEKLSYSYAVRDYTIA